VVAPHAGRLAVELAPAQGRVGPAQGRDRRHL
jgi:hypothetical protein